MTEIRPLERSDLPAVASLLDARLPAWTQDESFLAETLIDQRWANAELPSLVAVGGDGAIVGFIGAQARRIRVDGRKLRAVCCSHLVVADDPSVGPTGALLLRRMLSGKQELTWTDTATEGVARMWRTFGGHIDYTRDFDWMLVLRSVRWAREMLTTRVRRRVPVRQLAPARAIPLHAVGPRVVPHSFPSLPADVRGEDATAAAIAENFDDLTRDLRLCVEYDEASLDQLFSLIESAVGPPVHRVVRRGEVAIGWYAYVSRPGGASRVLHVCGRDSEIEAVFGELVHNARKRGTAVLTGRCEPHLRTPLIRRSAVLGFARCPMIHSRELEITALLGTGSSLLTDLDGEWLAT
jgi:predicted N-acetyltransferase YhbS